MRGLSRKRVLVTGSTRGIGYATAKLFLSEDAQVVLHGRTRQSVDQATADMAKSTGTVVTGFAADLGSSAECRVLVEAVGEIDILINCAGVLESVPVEQSDEAHWHRLMSVNVKAPWLLARGFLPALRERKGVVVNVSSDAG